MPEQHHQSVSLLCGQYLNQIHRLLFSLSVTHLLNSDLYHHLDILQMHTTIVWLHAGAGKYFRRIVGGWNSCGTIM